MMTEDCEEAVTIYGTRSDKALDGKIKVEGAAASGAAADMAGTPAKFVSFKRKRSSSQYKGVMFIKRQNKWRAQICLKRKKYYLGMYSTEEEAARARDRKVIEVFGYEADCLNFPETCYKIIEESNENQRANFLMLNSAPTSTSGSNPDDDAPPPTPNSYRCSRPSHMMLPQFPQLMESSQTAAAYSLAMLSGSIVPNFGPALSPEMLTLFAANPHWFNATQNIPQTSYGLNGFDVARMNYYLNVMNASN